MSTPNVSVPQTNYKQQLQQTFKGLKSTAGGFFDLNAQYAPKYTDLNLQTMARTLFGSPNAPGQLPVSAAANTYMRGADIADIQRYGRAGYDALMQSNPGLAQSLGNANQQGAGVFAPGGLMSNLQNTAQQQLQLGGQLSPQELTQINQATRSGFSDRGMLMGNQALGAELLGRDAAMQQRLGQRLGWAQGVEGLAGQNRQYLSQLAQLNAGVYDPSQQVISRGGTALGGLTAGGGSPLMGTVQTQNLFNPQQGQDAFNTNVNAQGGAAIANANAQSGQQNALIGAGASIVGGLAIAL
jgi:hypothetical protein